MLDHPRSEEKERTEIRKGGGLATRVCLVLVLDACLAFTSIVPPVSKTTSLDLHNPPGSEQADLDTAV